MKKQNIFIKLLSLLLCITLVSPTAVQAAGLGASDSVSGHWAEETLTYWDMLGLFDEIPDEEFGIDKAISRGAFVYIFNTMLGIGQTEKTAHNFTDIAENDWNYADIVTAYNTGYISGYPDNTFRADSPITREEMCTIISRYFDLDKVYDDGKLQNFTDKEKIQSYVLDHIGALAELETVNGYPDGSFKPQNNITYAEAVTIITRFLGYINGGSGVSGRIYYEGKPVYNAEITVYSHDTNEIAVQDTSDVYGDYILDTSAGIYDIVVAKNGTVSMLSGVEVGEDTCTYNKIILEVGQYVTGVLADENEKPLADAEFYIKGDTYVTVTTDENGEFTVILPVDGDYVILSEVNGKLTEITEFRTGGTEDGLDLGTVVVATGEKTAKTEGTTIKPPLWYLNSMIQNAINKDENNTDKDDSEEDDKTDEEETPEFDYSSLPYREPKTMVELVELNGGEQPYIEVNQNNGIGLYLGKISENKVNDVYDVIAELNNMKELLNMEDSRYEFIPSGATGIVNEKSYKLQQVYDGIQVWCAQTVVTVDNDGYINGIINNYIDTVKYAIANTDIRISQTEAIQIVCDDATTKGYEISSGVTATLTINPEELRIYWYVPVQCVNKAYTYYIDAVTGEIRGSIEMLPQTASFNLSQYDDSDIAEEKATFWGVNVDITKIKTGENQYRYVLYDDSYGGIAVYDADNHDENYESYPLDIIETSDNKWDTDNAVHLSGLYGLRHFQQTMKTYSNLGFEFTELPIEINVNLNYHTSAYSNGINNKIEFFFGNNTKNGVSETQKLDTIGHEYTHFVQNYHVGCITIDGREMSQHWAENGSIGDGYLKWDSVDNRFVEADSSNIDYLEAIAISEGTADIMGMLIEAKNEMIDIYSDEFWNWGEELQGNNNIRNYLLDSNDENTNYDVSEMTEYYKQYRYMTIKEDFSWNKQEYKKGMGCLISLETLKDFEKAIPSSYYDVSYLSYQKGGVGYNDCYILLGILKYLIDNTNILLDELLQLWYTTITYFNGRTEFDGLRFSLLTAANQLDMNEYSQAIINACNSVGITKENVVKADTWYSTSVTNVAMMGILNNFAESDNTYITTRNLSQQEYIQLVVDFCNEADANIIITYDNGIATLNKPIFSESSRESMSLIFDESKDILRWEAFIIAYRILNFCHAEFKDRGWKSLYNYSYIDENGFDHYGAFYNYITNNGKNIEYNLPDVSVEDILTKYYNGTDYTSFAEQHFVIKNTSSNEDENTYYSFTGIEVLEDNAHRIIVDAIYNMYRSLGKNLPVSVYSAVRLGELLAFTPPLANIMFSSKMTLADTCYLLYSFIK